MDQKSLLFYFLSRNLKKLLSNLNLPTSNFSNFKILPKKTCLNLRPQKLYLGFLGIEFEKAIFIFETGTLDFVWFQNVTKKQKCLNFGPKKPYLRFSTLEAEKGCFCIWNHNPQIRLIIKFCKKIKKYVISDKKYLIWVFCS